MLFFRHSMVTCRGRERAGGRDPGDGYSLSRAVGRAKFGGQGLERRKYMILR